MSDGNAGDDGGMIVVIDIETDCADPERANIIELGAVILTGDRIGESYYFELNRDIDGCPLRVNSIGAARVNGQPLGRCAPIPGHLLDAAFVKEKLIRFLEWLDFRNNRSITIAGINPHFDRRILLRYMEAFGIENDGFIRHNLIDLHTVAMMRGKESGREAWRSYMSSDDIFKALHLPTEPKPHQALQGAFWEACGFWSRGIAANCNGEIQDKIPGVMSNYTGAVEALDELFPHLAESESLPSPAE